MCLPVSRVRAVNAWNSQFVCVCVCLSMSLCVCGFDWGGGWCSKCTEFTVCVNSCCTVSTEGRGICCVCLEGCCFLWLLPSCSHVADSQPPSPQQLTGEAILAGAEAGAKAEYCSTSVSCLLWSPVLRIHRDRAC